MDVFSGYRKRPVGWIGSIKMKALGLLEMLRIVALYNTLGYNWDDYKFTEEPWCEGMLNSAVLTNYI